MISNMLPAVILHHVAAVQPVVLNMLSAQSRIMLYAGRLWDDVQAMCSI